MDKSHRCTLLLVFNLAEPDWMSIPSDQKLVIHILCYSKSGSLSKNDTNIRNLRDYSLCSPNDILIHGMCHIFI